VSGIRDPGENWSPTKGDSEEATAAMQCLCRTCGVTFPLDEVEKWLTAEGAKSLAEDAANRPPRNHVDPTAICPHCGETLVLSNRSGLEIAPFNLEMLRAGR
jgi:hypothetical protein